MSPAQSAMVMRKLEGLEADNEAILRRMVGLGAENAKLMKLVEQQSLMIEQLLRRGGRG